MVGRRVQARFHALLLGSHPNVLNTTFHFQSRCNPPPKNTPHPHQVGDFNLSRYMSRDDSFIKSSLENNPRWSAPEVIVEGRYSKVGGAAWCALVGRQPVCCAVSGSPTQ